MAPLALKRLMAELKAVRASMAAGEVPWLLRCEPIDDNLLGWRVDMRFPEDSLLQRSLDRFAAGLLDDARNMLHFQLRFPPEYPMRPPEIWLHKPRLKYESGTPVTFGGRVCIPRLTSSEWTPVTGIGAVLKEVQTQLVYAGAEVDATVAIRPYLEPPLMINRIQSGLIPDANDFVQENLQVMSPLEAGPFFGDLSRLEATDKIALSFEHGSAIYGRGDRIDLPIMFEVKARSGRKSHCAVFDFLTGLPPEVAIVPKWVMDDLGIRERDPVRVRGVRLDLVQFVKIQPHSVAFYEAVRESGVEAAVLLRESLSRFSALTEDTAIPIEIGRQAHDVHIVALEPKGAVRIIDQDMSADFEFKVDFEPAPNLEDEAETRARQEELRARQAEQDERKAAAAAAAQEKRAAAIRGRFERARDGAREAAGADDGTEGEVQLRLRLPTGAAVEGAFREGAPVTALVALVLGTDWAEGCSPWGLQLLCGFPRRTLAEGDTVTKDMHRTTISVQEERPPDDDDAVLAAALPPPPAPPPPAAPGAAGGGLARALWAAVFGAAGEDEVAAPGWVREGSRDEAVRRGSADAQALGACPPLDEAVLQAQTVKMFEVQRFVQAGLAPEEARRRAEAGDTAPPGLRPQPEALPPPARSRVPPPPPRPPSPPRDDLARQVSDVRRYTGAPDALATQFLEQNGWDTERAVNAFFDAM